MCDGLGADGEIFEDEKTPGVHALQGLCFLPRDRASAISRLDVRRREKHGGRPGEGARVGDGRRGSSRQKRLSTAGVCRRWREKEIAFGFAAPLFSALFLRTYLLGEASWLPHEESASAFEKGKSGRKERASGEMEFALFPKSRSLMSKKESGEVPKILRFFAASLAHNSETKKKKKKLCTQRQERDSPEAFLFAVPSSPLYVRTRRERAPGASSDTSKNGVRRDAVGPDARQPPPGRRDDAR